MNKNTLAILQYNVNKTPDQIMAPLLSDENVWNTISSPYKSLGQTRSNPLLTSQSSAASLPGAASSPMSICCIGPYEANALHSKLLDARHVSMHLYAPRQNQGFSPVDKLNLYSIPTSSRNIKIPTAVRVQLNLFCRSAVHIIL
jgi:hypothetical protein